MEHRSEKGFWSYGGNWRYVLHRLLHRVPFLWAFHKVHHSATTLNPMTVFRTHPVEGILFNMRGALAQGTCISLFYYAFGNSIDLWTIFGVIIGVFIFHAGGSNLRHSHVHISYWRWLEKWIISPAQHQIHHSVAPKHLTRILASHWHVVTGFLLRCTIQKNIQKEKQWNLAWGHQHR